MPSWTDSDCRSDRPFSENKAPTRCLFMDSIGAWDPSETPDLFRAFTLPAMCITDLFPTREPPGSTTPRW